MVGDPKHLSDLSRIEADVRIRCRRCGFEHDWTVAALSRHLHETGGSSAWTELTRTLCCRRFGCGSPDVRALIVPFARRPANMPRRVGALDRQIVDAALAILDAAARDRGGSVATLDVRLALLVLHRYARDRQAIVDFWTRAGIANHTVNDQLNGPLTRLRQSLVQRGWLAPDIAVERTRTWPWSSPAPPGWKAQSAYGHERMAHRSSDDNALGPDGAIVDGPNAPATPPHDASTTAEPRIPTARAARARTRTRR